MAVISFTCGILRLSKTQKMIHHNAGFNQYSPFTDRILIGRVACWCEYACACVSHQWFGQGRANSLPGLQGRVRMSCCRPVPPPLLWAGRRGRRASTLWSSRHSVVPSTHHEVGRGDHGRHTEAGVAVRALEAAGHDGVLWQGGGHQQVGHGGHTARGQGQAAWGLARGQQEVETWRMTQQ